MTDRRFNRQRFIRFACWAVAMCITSMIVGSYAPQRAVFIPCFFLCIMTPAVLLPLKPKAIR